MNLPIATELLAAERETLLRDHYEVPAEDETCDGCLRANTVRNELAVIRLGDYWSGYQAGYNDGKVLAISEMTRALLPSKMKDALLAALQKKDGVTE